MNDRPASDYIAALRAQSTVRFAPDVHIALTNMPAYGHLIDVEFFTNWRDEGVGANVPRDLMIEVRTRSTGEFRSIIGMLADFGTAVSSVLSVAANAVIDSPQPWVAYDATPGRSERQFIQMVVSEDQGLPAPVRLVVPQATLNFIMAVMQNPNTSALHRACLHYGEALRYWRHGMDTYCVGQLWIAVEALTKLMRTREAKRAGLASHRSLADLWSVKRDQIDQETRRRIIFQGDADTCDAASDVSNGYEHAYGHPGQIRTSARRIRNLTARCVRSAIIDLAGVDETDRLILESQTFVEPLGFIDYFVSVQGLLIGTSDTLATEGERYPRLRIKPSLVQIARANPGGERDVMTMDLSLSWDEIVADGIGFEPDSVEHQVKPADDTDNTDG